MKTFSCQVNGKPRTKITVEDNITDNQIISEVMKNSEVQKFTNGKQVIKEVIFNNIINIVVR